MCTPDFSGIAAGFYPASGSTNTKDTTRIISKSSSSLRCNLHTSTVGTVADFCIFCLSGNSSDTCIQGTDTGHTDSYIAVTVCDFHPVLTVLISDYACHNTGYIADSSSNRNISGYCQILNLLSAATGYFSKQTHIRIFHIQIQSADHMSHTVKTSRKRVCIRFSNRCPVLSAEADIIHQFRTEIFMPLIDLFRKPGKFTSAGNLEHTVFICLRFRL